MRERIVRCASPANQRPTRKMAAAPAMRTSTMTQKGWVSRLKFCIMAAVLPLSMEFNAAGFTLSNVMFCLPIY
ncbi:MAG TPA: hypothetical protein VFF90_08025, partial [Saprospiraceae bacterium]|nr:hypothetical protein [Saprospiraceae bacterium]